MNTKRPIFILFYLLLFFISTPLLLGFLNFLHPLFDSFSHFRIQLLWMTLLLLLMLIFLHQKIYRVIYLLLLIILSIYLYTINQPFIPSTLNKEKRDSFTHMQFNLNFKNKKIEDFTKYIQKNPIDIITLQEVTNIHRKALEELKVNGLALELSKEFPFVKRKKGAYPYQAYCSFRSVGAVAVLSKYPFEKETTCLDDATWVKVHLPKITLNVFSTHLHWPYPYQQTKQVQKLLPLLKSISTPTLIAGDFNAAPWSHTLKEIASASHTNIVEGLRWSIELKKQLPLLPFMKLPIDHLLLSNEFQVVSIKVKESIGSDHLPIVSKINY